MLTRYLLVLGIGHLLGDFYVQNDKSARHKDKKYKGVLLHSFAYYAAVFLVILPVFSLDMVLAATCSAAAHFVIDTLKYVFWVKKVIRKKRIFVCSGSMCASNQYIYAGIYDGCLEFFNGAGRDCK